MAFLVYFFVLLVMASSIMFGLDWVRAPLHSPSAQQTHVAASGTPHKSEPQQKPRATVAAVPIGRTQTASSVAQQPPEPPQAQPVRQAARDEPAVVTEQKAAVTEQKQASVPVPETTPVPAPAPERVAKQETPPPAATTGAAAPADVQKAEAKREVREPDAAASTASQTATAAKKRSRTAARRNPERERSARVPSWALRGAEAAQREAEERHDRVPPWAMQGAEAARRQVEEVHARPTFRPFWVSRDEPWRW